MCFQGSISAGEEYSISVSACEGNIHENQAPETDQS